MTFSRKIILIAAVALAISLGTVCSSFDATPEVNHQTAEPTATSEATNSTLPPENGAANNAAARQTNPRKQTLQEDQRCCHAWALDNLKPHIYAEFVLLVALKPRITVLGESRLHGVGRSVLDPQTSKRRLLTDGQCCTNTTGLSLQLEPPKLKPRNPSPS